EGIQDARDAGDERGDRERVQLDRAGVDRGGGRGALVGADREHLLAELAAPEEADPHAEQDAAGQAEEAEDRRRHVAVDAAETGVRAEVDAEEVRLGDGRARRAAAPGGVREAEVLDGDGAGQGDDGERDAADPDRRDRGDDADDHGDRNADEGADQRGDAEVDGHVAHREPGGAGEAELDDGDLADVAGDDHEGQGHDRADQRVDERLAEVVGEDDQQHHADDGADQRGPPQVLRARCLGQAALDQVPAAGDARPAPEQHADDDEEREQVNRAGQGDAAGLREPGLGGHVVDQRVQDAEDERRDGGAPERGERRDQRGGQGRDDLQRQGPGVKLGDGGGEDAEDAGQQRGQQGVREADADRVEAAEHGRGLVLRGGAGRQAEPGPLVDRPERGGDHKDAYGEDDDVPADDRAEHREARGREDGRLRLRGGAEGEEHRRLGDQQDAEAGDHLRQGRGVAQRPEDSELDKRTAGHHEQQGKRQRGTRRQGGDLSGGQRPVGVAAEHRHRADREVDDARAPVGQHDAERYARDERAGPEAQHDEQQYLVHCASFLGRQCQALPDLSDLCLIFNYFAGMRRSYVVIP